jgi:hypothetical protein
MMRTAIFALATLLGLLAPLMTLADAKAASGTGANAPAQHSAKSREKSGGDHMAFVPTSDYKTQNIEGWTIHVNKHLLSDQKALGHQALRLLDVKLYDITRVIPPKALERLREVPIWLGVNDGHAPCSEYHPNREWLAANGYNPDKAKCVEIGNASRFVDWSHDQPFMVLHELAHAYHDRVLGWDAPEIKAAYEHALKTGLYQSVLRCDGTTGRAYALTDEHEYFAEGTESYFGTNDYYPFVRAELKAYDPMLADLLKKVWGVP